MPIQIPNLDDRNYEQLLRETESLIARYFPDYSDIELTDPAVAINELFCYFFDMVSYQINRITPDTRRNFAALLGIPLEYGSSPEELISRALSKLSRVNRAITASDIEALVIQASKTICSKDGEIQRVRVVPGADRTRVYVLQTGALRTLTKAQKTELEKDLQRVYDYLRLCSPITTHLSIEQTPFLDVSIMTEVVKRRDSTISNDSLAKAIEDKIKLFYDPFKGGDKGEGFEYDRPLTRGDVYELIEGTPGVDYVRSLYIKESSKPDYDKVNAPDRLSPPGGGIIRLRQTARKGEEKWLSILGQSTPSAS